jgi:hypothetical protein
MNSPRHYKPVTLTQLRTLYLSPTTNARQRKSLRPALRKAYRTQKFLRYSSSVGKLKFIFTEIKVGNQILGMTFLPETDYIKFLQKLPQGG